jgi:hypothetical protein
MNRPVLILACAALCVTGWPAPAQGPDDMEDLRFVRELRARRYNDLALEYLERLKKSNPSPELAAELPLETARTLLDGAADEPDSARRVALYGQAQAVFAEFLAKNPQDPRAGEVRYDFAQVAVQHGRTQLSRALLQDSAAGRAAEFRKARVQLEKAGELIAAARAAMDAELAKLAEAKTDKALAQKKKLEEARGRAELGQAVNLIDQAQTYDEAKLGEKQARAKKVEQAAKLLEPIAAGDAANPFTWQARAWIGRCSFELGDPKKARAKFTEVLGAERQAAAAEGQRLARYFRLIVIKENPEPKENAPAVISDAGARWLADYPGHLNTPEGYGARYLLAEAYADEAEHLKPKTGSLTEEQQKKRAKYLADARKLLKEIEQTENDFTDRARRLKIRIIGDQGGLAVKVENLQTFDSCYVRAQYEVLQMVAEAAQAKDPKELEANRKQRMDAAIRALERGLGMKDAGNKELAQEANNARAMLTYYQLNAGRYKEAVQAGEAFARGNPRVAQAAMAAVYALQAYSMLVSQKEEKFATPEELRDEREGMRKLAEYMEQHWPAELAGDVARHQTGLSLLREKNIPEAIRALSRITPGYPSYAFSQYKLAEAALEAEKARLEPLPGDKPGEYRRRAVAALEAIPDPVGAADPAANRVYVLAKTALGREWFKDKKFKEMDDLAQKLLGRVAELHLDDDRARDEAVRQQFTADVTDLRLYARYGLADAQMAAGNHAAVAALLDGEVVDRMKDGQLPQARKNLQLATALLGMDLRANVQLGKLDRALLAVEAMQGLSEDPADSLALLRQLSALIRSQVEELTKKDDQENLARAKAGFAGVLAKLAQKQSQPTPEFRLSLAQNYSSLEEYGKAVEQLEKLPAPKPGVQDPDEREKLLRAARILLIRELRLNKEADRANKLLDEIMGSKERREWGARNVDALLEKVYLLEEAKDYKQAATLANNLVKQLHQRATTDNAMKERYLECYYQVAYCTVKHGQGLSDVAKAAQYVKEAAGQIVELERKWMGFGSDASAKRFQELLEREPELKAQYDKLKAK